MPPVTRSSELLNLVDGLYYIDQDVIDTVSLLYCDLRTTMSTFGEDSVQGIIPHISTLMNKFDHLSKVNGELALEVEVLRDNLSLAEDRCLNLNTSYKDISVQCCELEDQYSASVARLSAQLDQCREDKARLQLAVDRSVAVDNDALLQESRERMDTLVAERKCLLTTIEVLEADVKSLRAELRKAESHSRQRRALSTADDSLLAELMAAEETLTAPAPTRHTTSTSPPPTSCRSLPATTPPPTHVRPSTSAASPSRPNDNSFSNVLLIGDSHLRYSATECSDRGAHVAFCPGGKTLDVRNELLSYLGYKLDVIYLHVGANNLKRGYRGGPGYNGGHGKREALHSMADLLYTARTNFPEAKVILSSVLVRRDISYRALLDFNTQLELMCGNFGVEFLETNSCVRRRDLNRDGVHFNRRATSRLGALFASAVSSALKCAPNATETSDLSSEPEIVTLTHDSLFDISEAPQVSEN